MLHLYLLDIFRDRLMLPAELFHNRFEQPSVPRRANLTSFYRPIDVGQYLGRDSHNHGHRFTLGGIAFLSLPRRSAAPVNQLVNIGLGMAGARLSGNCHQATLPTSVGTAVVS